MAIPNRAPQVEAVAILFLVLTWIAVSLRCYVKLCITKLFRIDDWLAMASLVSFTLYCTFVLKGAQNGTGRHKQDLTKEEFSAGMMWWYGGEISYVTTTGLIKACISLFLLQICVNRYQKFTIWVVIVVSSVFSVAYLCVMIFQCHPLSFFWTRFLGESGTCIPSTVIADMTYAHGAISTWSDWTLGVLPIFLVWNLKMNPRTKVSVALILSLGALGSTASIVRFPFIHKLTATQDFLWANTDVSIWSTVEPGIGITASSMATMRPLFLAFLSRSRLFGSTSSPSRADRYPKNGSRLGYFRKKETTDDEFELHSDLSKSIRVITTITKTQSTRGDRKNELGSGASDSEIALKGERKWSGDGGSCEDPGHSTYVEAGMGV